MKNILISLCVASLMLVAVVASADKGLPVFKKGEAVFACTCGEGCDCKTLSRKEGGTCSCGKPLGKATISQADKDKAMVKIGGKEVSFPTKAKYACGCGEACGCGTISQKPGKCGCGKELKKL